MSARSVGGHQPGSAQRPRPADHGGDRAHGVPRPRRRLERVRARLRLVAAALGGRACTGPDRWPSRPRRARSRSGSPSSPAASPVSSGPTQRAEVDAHVEEREAGVAALVVLGVERADQRGRVRLHAAAAERDQHQADADAGQARAAATSAMWPNMTTHARVEQRPLRADAAGRPARRRGSWTGRPRRRTRRRCRSAVRLVDAEAALGRPSSTGRSAGSPACRRSENRSHISTPNRLASGARLPEEAVVLRAGSVGTYVVVRRAHPVHGAPVGRAVKRPDHPGSGRAASTCRAAAPGGRAARRRGRSR